MLAPGESQVNTINNPISNPEALEANEVHLSPDSRTELQNTLFDLYGNTPYPLLILDNNTLVCGNPASISTLEETGHSDFFSMLGDSKEELLEQVGLFRQERKQGMGISRYVKNKIDPTRYNGGFWKFGVESTAKTGEALIRMEMIDKELLDPVSGAYNMNAYGLYEKEINRMLIDKPGIPIQVVVADTTCLKEINDGISHIAGDEAIWETASLLMTGRKGDLVFRNGAQSDEMFVIKVNSGEEQEEGILKRIRKEEKRLVAERITGYPDKVKILPPEIASIAVVSSDSILFQPERDADIPLSMDILLAVADQMRYAVKRAGKVAEKINPIFRREQIINGAIREIGLLMNATEMGSNRNRFYNNLLAQINETNCDSFGLAVEDLSLLSLALIGHEVGDNPATQGDKETVVKPEQERRRIPLYSQQFFNALSDKTGLSEFKTVAHIVSRHHLRFNEEGYPVKDTLDMASKEDRMANMINIIDAFYSICNRQEKASEKRPRINDPEAAYNILQTERSDFQFNPSLVANLKELLLKAQKAKDIDPELEERIKLLQISSQNE